MARFGVISPDRLGKAPRSEWDRIAGAIAARQHGLVVSAQLRALGMSASTIDNRVRAARLIRLHRGVFAVGHEPLEANGYRLAAVLACGRGAVLSHVAAAALWRIRESSASLIDVTAPGRRGRRRSGIRVHSADRLPGSQVTEVLGIPCTTVARTIVDAAGMSSAGATEYMLHRAQTQRVFDRSAVAEALAASPTRAGSAAVRRVLGLSLPDEDELNGMLERKMLGLVRAAGLPAPLTDHYVAVPDGGFEVDFCWPELRLIVEADGRAYHATDRGFENDRRRDRRLRLAGWRVARFTWRDATERCADTIADLRRFGALGPEGLG